MEKKLIFNEHGDRGTQSMVGGNTTNLREWNRIKYDWANTLYRTMLNNFWIPEEISLNEDIKQFPYLTDSERRAFDKIISFLNFLDSIQSENLPNLSRYITASEVASLLNIQAFQEEIHAQSYSYILDTVTNPITRDRIYDEWRTDEHLLARNRFIADIYQRFSDEPSEHNLIRTIMANYILEGIYFYSGFSFFYTLARQGKMTATSTIFKYINRDEVTHLVLFQNIIRELRIERPELFTPELEAEMKAIQKEVSQVKEDFVHYINKDSAAFMELMGAFKLPKETDEEKVFRKAEIQRTTKQAALVPYEIGKLAYTLLPLTETVIVKGNTNAITDGMIAVINARAAVKSAFLNVKINLGSIQDAEFVKQLADSMEEIEAVLDAEEQRLVSLAKL